MHTFCEVEENKAPSFMTIDNFMNNSLLDNTTFIRMKRDYMEKY